MPSLPTFDAARATRNNGGNSLNVFQDRVSLQLLATDVQRHVIAVHDPWQDSQVIISVAALTHTSGWVKPVEGLVVGPTHDPARLAVRSHRGL